MEMTSWQFLQGPNSSELSGVLGSLAESAQKSFEILELCQNNRGDDPLVRKIVSRIAKNGPIYYRAIQTSTETAQYNNAFATDVISFCNSLIRGEHSTNTLQRAVEDIIQVAEMAHEGSMKMQIQFRELRRELLEISKANLSNVSQANNGESDEENQGRLLVISQLQRTNADLEILVQEVSRFVDWWDIIKAQFIALQRILPKVEISESTRYPIDLEDMRGRWQIISAEFTQYQRTIVNVEDYYRNLSKVPSGRGAFPQRRLNGTINKQRARSKSIKPHETGREVKRGNQMKRFSFTNAQNARSPEIVGPTDGIAPEKVRFVKKMRGGQKKKFSFNGKRNAGLRHQEKVGSNEEQPGDNEQLMKAAIGESKPGFVSKFGRRPSPQSSTDGDRQGATCDGILQESEGLVQEAPPGTGQKTRFSFNRRTQKKDNLRDVELGFPESKERLAEAPKMSLFNRIKAGRPNVRIGARSK